MDLTVNNSASNFLEARIGTTLRYSNKNSTGTKYCPELRASYGYDLIGDNQRTVSSFAGQTATFTSDAEGMDRKSLKLGAGLMIYSVGYLSFNLDYGYEMKEKYQSHTGLARVRYDF